MTEEQWSLRDVTQRQHMDNHRNASTAIWTVYVNCGLSFCGGRRHIVRDGLTEAEAETFVRNMRKAGP